MTFRNTNTFLPFRVRMTVSVSNVVRPSASAQRESFRNCCDSLNMEGNRGRSSSSDPASSSSMVASFAFRSANWDARLPQIGIKVSNPPASERVDEAEGARKIYLPLRNRRVFRVKIVVILLRRLERRRGVFPGCIIAFASYPAIFFMRFLPGLSFCFIRLPAFSHVPVPSDKNHVNDHPVSYCTCFSAILSSFVDRPGVHL